MHLKFVASVLVFMCVTSVRVNSLKIALFTPGISKSHVLFSHRLAQTLLS
jgi:hypothetical protein